VILKPITATVNHQSHNTPFFYALLVTAKHITTDARRRYSIKHFVFRRGDKDFYEIPQRHVEFANTPLVWPASESQTDHADHSDAPRPPARADRAYDSEIISEFYPGIRPFSSQKLGGVLARPAGTARRLKGAGCPARRFVRAYA